MPHSIVGYDLPRRIRWRWFTLSSAPQKPRAASFGDEAAAVVVDGIVLVVKASRFYSVKVELRGGGV